MQPEIVLHPVGLVGVGGHNRRMIRGIPKSRRSCWKTGFGPEALAGLSDFSHIEVVFHFNQVTGRRDSIRRAPSARPQGLAAGRHLRPARQGPAQPHRRDGVPPLVGRGPNAESARPRRHRRHAGPGHQAGHEGLSAARRNHRARMGQRTDEGLLGEDGLAKGPVDLSPDRAPQRRAAKRGARPGHSLVYEVFWFTRKDRLR